MLHFGPCLVMHASNKSYYFTIHKWLINYYFRPVSEVEVCVFPSSVDKLPKPVQQALGM